MLPTYQIIPQFMLWLGVPKFVVMILLDLQFYSKSGIAKFTSSGVLECGISVKRNKFMSLYNFLVNLKLFQRYFVHLLEKLKANIMWLIRNRL